jgi:hypothetical protein
MAAMVSWIEPRVAYHLDGGKNGYEIEELLKAKARDLTNERIETAGVEIPEGPMKGYSASRFPEPFGGGPQSGAGSRIKFFSRKPYFHVHAKFQN